MYKYAEIDLVNHQPGLAPCLTKAFQEAGLEFANTNNSAWVFLPSDPEKLNKMLQYIRRLIQKVDGVAARVEFPGIEPQPNHGSVKGNGYGRLVQLVKG